MKNSRIKYLDIAKGFGMIFIVWGHTHGFFANQFLLVSVGMFFIISGFLHNQNISFKEFLIKKLHRLYLPFVCCNLFLPTIVLIKRYFLNLDIKYNIIYIIKIILTFEKDGFLFGATWFLGSLFLIAIVIKALEEIIKSNKKYFFICVFILFLIFLSGSILNLNYQINRTIIGALFYFIGIILSQKKQIFKAFISNNLYIDIFLAIALVICWNKIILFRYDNYNCLTLLLFVISTIVFSFCILRISKFIEIRLPKYSKFIALIGENSLNILIWQFVFIEILSAFILYLNNIPVAMIERFPHVVCESHLCILLYFIFGLFGPLILTKFYKTCVIKVSKKSL